MTEYEPELGQAFYGQPWQEYRASPLLRAALNEIDEELQRVMWNIHQKEYPSPFSNTANHFVCPTFEVHAYEWDADEEQPYNFKYKDILISWYKYLGRGTSINRKISNDEIEILLNDCLDALALYEKENDPDGDIH